MLNSRIAGEAWHRSWTNCGGPISQRCPKCPGTPIEQTKWQALELGPLGITCNALEPRLVVAGISKGYTDLMSPEEAADFEAYWADKTPVGRVGQPIDIAYAALFLAQDSSGFINGASLPMDGGASIRM